MTKGADIGFYSNLPRAAGLSTSSALITAVFLVLAEVNRLEQDPRYVSEIGSRWQLAGYLGSIENGKAFLNLPGDQGVGTSGGSQDHTAILLSEAGLLGVYHYHPGRAHAPARRCPRTSRSSSRRAASRPRRRAARASGTTAPRRWSRRWCSQWRHATGRDDATLADALASSPDAADRLRSAGRPVADPRERAALRVAARTLPRRERRAPAGRARRARRPRASTSSAGWSIDRRRRPSGCSATRCPRPAPSPRWRGPTARWRRRRSAPGSAAACGRSSRRHGPTRS